MHGNWLSDDEAIANQFSDRLSGIRILDLVALGGIKPNLALTTADD